MRAESARLYSPPIFGGPAAKPRNTIKDRTAKSKLDLEPNYYNMLTHSCETIGHQRSKRNDTIYLPTPEEPLFCSVISKVRFLVGHQNELSARR
ncbi:hypothetical protein V6N11_077744 [Hibiscus sabdariffa]|uniref:Uncharacterized protein n=1 Tax=Hibiscus sabdariffa TaxID=183260 RepID=A0ABR2TDZ2_9ROSI